MNNWRLLTSTATSSCGPAIRDGLDPRLLFLLLVLALGSTTTLRSQPESDDEDRAPRDEAVAAAELGLSEEELATRREALEQWTFEPVALEETDYTLHMDRRNARFVLRDLRTGAKWYSSWGRKGFASMLL